MITPRCMANRRARQADVDKMCCEGNKSSTRIVHRLSVSKVTHFVLADLRLPIEGFRSRRVARAELRHMWLLVLVVSISPRRQPFASPSSAMSADFWAGYLSGAAGIIIGNPLDLIKTRIQSGNSQSVLPAAPISTNAPPNSYARLGELVKGSAAPVLGYGALNALLFMSYNRSMYFMHEDPANPSSLTKTWLAGAVAGLATFVVSAPTELIKCRVQVSKRNVSSLEAAREIWRGDGFRGLYWGGGITSLRDGVGYGF